MKFPFHKTTALLFLFISTVLPPKIVWPIQQVNNLHTEVANNELLQILKQIFRMPACSKLNFKHPENYSCRKIGIKGPNIQKAFDC